MAKTETRDGARSKKEREEAAAAAEEEQRNAEFLEALADRLDCEPEDILGYAVVVEHMRDDMQTISWLWPTAAPMWRIEGWLRYVLRRATV